MSKKRLKDVFGSCSDNNLPIKDATLSGGTLQIHNFKGAGRDIQKYKMVPEK